MVLRASVLTALCCLAAVAVLAGPTSGVAVADGVSDADGTTIDADETAVGAAGPTVDAAQPTADTGAVAMDAAETRNVTAMATIDDDVGEAAIADADAAGVHHVAYTNERRGAVHYVRVTTDGKVIERTTVATVDGVLDEVAVVSEPDGTAHVVWHEKKDDPKAVSVVRATLEDGAVTDRYEALGRELGETEAYRIQDVAIDDSGTVHVVAVNEQCPHPRYDYMIDLLSIDRGASDHRTTKVHGFHTEDGYTFGAAVAVRGETLVVGLTDGDFFERTTKVFEYQRTAEGLEPVANATVAESDGGTVKHATVHPDGTPLVSHSVDGGGTVATDGTPFMTQWFQTGLWTDDRFYAFRTDAYTVYDTDGDELGRSQTIEGFVGWGANAADRPSVLRIVAGELRFEAMGAVVNEGGGESDGGGAPSNSSPDSNSSDGSSDPGSGTASNGSNGDGGSGESGGDSTGEDAASHGEGAEDMPGFGVLAVVLALTASVFAARLWRR